MAVKIRLTRMGAKKRPFYRIVVKETRSKRDGKSIEVIGSYNPLPNPSTVIINSARYQWWIDHGAKPTKIVNKLAQKSSQQPPPDTTEKARTKKDSFAGVDSL